MDSDKKHFASNIFDGFKDNTKTKIGFAEAVKTFCEDMSACYRMFQAHVSAHAKIGETNLPQFI